MVPCEKLLAEAKRIGADIIGVSGLITPSLDEMVHIAKEMKREGFDVPLLIGGATTSAAHTAVKIAPEFGHGVVHVLDASRVVNVASALLSDEQKPAFLADILAKQEKQRVDFAERRNARKLLSLAEARRRAQPTDWATVDIPTPEFTGTQVFSSEGRARPLAAPQSDAADNRPNGGPISLRIASCCASGPGVADVPAPDVPSGPSIDIAAHLLPRHPRCQPSGPQSTKRGPRYRGAL
jgi:5-methyltetrahydrofolate--homocysteine methyltransferase